MRLSVYLVQQAGQAVSAAQELPFDDGRVLEEVVVRNIGPFGGEAVNLLADFVRLLHPVGRLSGGDLRSLFVRQPVDLLLPLAVTPFVDRLGNVRIPDRMQVRVASEETHGRLLPPRSLNRPRCIGQCMSPTR